MYINDPDYRLHSYLIFLYYNLDKKMNSAVEEATQWTLAKNSEFRFEVDFDKTCTIKMLTGTSEIFGSELACNIEYSFTGRKLAIYTWHGCTLETKGAMAVAYVGQETPMLALLDLFFNLQQEYACLSADQAPPRLMVVGPSTVGKSVLCKTLVNYAAKLHVAKQGYPFLFVDIDPSHVFLN